MNNFFLIAFGIYSFILFAIGLFFYKKTKSEIAFAVGNRSINYWVTAIATQASDMGGWLFLGLPAAVFVGGVFESWSAIGLVFFMFLTWHFVAPALREKTSQLQCTTIPEYLEEVTGTKNIALQLISSILMLTFFTFYITSGLVGIGRVFESSLGFSYHTGVIVGLIAGTLYTLIGGFAAVAWCDMFQGIFLLVAIVLVPLYAFLHLDSFSTITMAFTSHNISTSLFTSSHDVFNALFLAAGWGLGYFGQPHILTNFMGIDSTRNVKYAKYVGITWQILVLGSSVAIGLVGRAYFIDTPIEPQLVFIALTNLLFHPLIAAFILCAIIAATLSSIDSQILLSGSVIAQHILRATKQSSNQTYYVLLSRAGSIFIALVALAIAWHNNNTIYDLVNYAWSGLGAAFGPAILMSLYKKKVHARQLIAGMLTGALVVTLWPYTGIKILSLVPAFCASLFMIQCTK